MKIRPVGAELFYADRRAENLKIEQIYNLLKNPKKNNYILRTS